MRHTKPGKTPLQSNPSRNGYVLIIIVLILASIFSVVLVKMTIQSIVFLQTSSLRIAEANLLSLEKSCAQENLIQLTRDPDYLGGTITLNDGNCISTISANGDFQNINLTVTQNSNSDNLSITFDPAQKTIVAWDN